MRPLHIAKISEELYRALRNTRRSNRRSISAEVRQALKASFPTARELKSRRDLYRVAARMRARKPVAPGPFPTTEEMQREDQLR